MAQLIREGKNDLEFKLVLVNAAVIPAPKTGVFGSSCSAMLSSLLKTTLSDPPYQIFTFSSPLLKGTFTTLVLPLVSAYNVLATSSAFSSLIEGLNFFKRDVANFTPAP